MAGENGMAITRRNLLAGAAAGLTVPAAFGQSIETRSDDNLHLTVPITVNGHGPYRFVVDTCAERTIVSDRIVTELGLSQGPPVTVEGLVRSVQSFSVAIDTLDVGVAHHGALLAPVLPRAMLGADGYLGLDIINASRVTLDFRHQSLMIELSRQLLDRGRENQARIKASGTGGHLRSTECWLDGVRTTAFFDTGAEVSVGNQALLAGLKEQRGEGFRPLPPVQLIGVTGGAAEALPVSIQRVKFAKLQSDFGTVMFVDLPIFALWDLADEPALLIGMDYMRRFDRVTIDYRIKEFRFDVGSLLQTGRGTLG
jgi:predicted aspartyl protease